MKWNMWRGISLHYSFITIPAWTEDCTWSTSDGNQCVYICIVNSLLCWSHLCCTGGWKKTKIKYLFRSFPLVFCCYSVQLLKYVFQKIPPFLNFGLLCSLVRRGGAGLWRRKKTGKFCLCAEWSPEHVSMLSHSFLYSEVGPLWVQYIKDAFNSLTLF